LIGVFAACFLSIGDCASPLSTLIIASIQADDAFVVQLACEPLHALIKERFANSGSVKTTVSGAVECVAFRMGQGLVGRGGGGQAKVGAEQAVVAHEL